MLNKIKDLGWQGLGLIMIVGFAIIVALLLHGGVELIKAAQGVIDVLNMIIIGAILFLLVLSVVPRLRLFTGLGIAYASMLWIFLLWLNCLAVTYELWGFIGVFIGIFMLGLGVFVTAPLALLFAGEGGAALMLVINIAIMYGVKLLGAWVASKYKGPAMTRDEDVSLEKNFQE